MAGLTTSKVPANLLQIETMCRWRGAQLVPGKGVYLPTFQSHVTHTLQSTLTAGFFEFLVEGLDSDSRGGKTKLASMHRGCTDLTDNPHRFTFEKRGDDHPDVGKYRTRIITGNALTGSCDSERILPTSTLVVSKLYRHRVTWGSGVVTLNVRETTATGVPLVSDQFTCQGTHRPNPHVVHIGAPAPRGGELDASVPGITARFFDVSQGGSYPGFADIAAALGPSCVLAPYPLGRLPATMRAPASPTSTISAFGCSSFGVRGSHRVV